MWKRSLEMCWRRPKCITSFPCCHTEQDSAFKGSNRLLLSALTIKQKASREEKRNTKCSKTLSHSQTHTSTAFHLIWRIPSRDETQVESQRNKGTDRITLLSFFFTRIDNNFSNCRLEHQHVHYDFDRRGKAQITYSRVIIVQSLVMDGRDFWSFMGKCKLIIVTVNANN